MPIVPDQPFPKVAGSPIRSKDWNDVVTEVQRLDNAKVNRSGADRLAGPLTIANALGVGTNSAAARLHVVDAVTPAVARIQSTQAFGTARVELWSDPQGSATEWRPAFIESIDMGGFTGGLSFKTNGAGQANRTGAVEALRLVNGKAAFGGVTTPGFSIDTGDRIRLRQGASGSAGMWLYQTTPNADRSFIGMLDDNSVGFWGQPMNRWGLWMDVATGNVTCVGRVRDQKLRLRNVASDQITISASGTSGAWNNISGMSMSIQSPGAYFHIRFSMNGVQTHEVAQGYGYFRLLVNGTQVDVTRQEWPVSGWSLRNVQLETVWYLAAGANSIAVQWLAGTGSGNVQLTGCWYNDLRQLIAIEL